MKIKYAIAALAATTMMSGAALADSKGKKHRNHDRTSATSVNGGVAAAGRDGAAAGGVVASQSTGRPDMRNMRLDPQANSATTSTSGAVYTSRRSGSAAINTNGAASGTGSVRSSSEGEVYSSTTRNGSDADAYGNSDAWADQPRRPN